jgi:hypothetical protein
MSRSEAPSAGAACGQAEAFDRPALTLPPRGLTWSALAGVQGKLGAHRTLGRISRLICSNTAGLAQW